ncbi:MAG: SAF domain-containing protein [Anaerolineae bacterium]|nr:SAF domain-containing protein [Anaerolineae bacterium]
MIRFLVVSSLLLVGFAQNTQQPEVVPVVVALQDIPRGFFLNEDAVIGESAVVGIVLYPADYLPAGAVQSLEQVISQWVRVDIPREQPVSAYFLAPDLRQNPEAELPFPVSPSGYRMVKAGLVEVSYDQPEKLRFPDGLAAGDEVMIISTTGLKVIWQDETRILIPRATITLLTEETIIFSVTPEEQTPLTEYLATGFPVTLAAYSALAPVTPVFATDMITWDILITRPVNPLVLPEGADVLNLRTLNE